MGEINLNGGPCSRSFTFAADQCFLEYLFGPLQRLLLLVFSSSLLVEGSPPRVKEHCFSMSKSRQQPQKSYDCAPLADNRPLAIGANFHDDPICRSTNRKSHALGLETRQDAAYSPHTQYNYTGTSSDVSWMYQTSATVVGGSAANKNNNNNTSSASLSTAEEAPTLRFLAYTREIVPESPEETTRIRRMGIVFHSQDGSIAIREAKQPNSGLMQGPVLLRQQVPRDPCAPTVHLGIEDFHIGCTVNIYGRDYHIVDCDESTRQYLRNVLGRENVPDVALPWPTEEDAYNVTVQRRATRDPKKAMPSNIMDQKRVVEQLASGIISKHPPDEVRMAQQFLANKINEHLQFAALWDDRASISGDLRHCAVRYFLENDTIEIIEVRPDNAGREGGNKLLCRQRVAKNEAGEIPLHAAAQNTFGIILKENYMEPTDFILGANVRIHKRDYFVYDADSFTRQYLKKTFGVELPPAVDISEIVNRGKVYPPLQIPPPHDGIGTEEDSLQNWKYLSLRPPRVDLNKRNAEEGKVMVFAASFAPPIAPEDKGRRFVVCFYRATDEVEVIESNVRNSGVVGGKFLAKRRHLKKLPDGRQVPYSPSDFITGGSVTIMSRTFILEDIDQRSQRLIDGIPDPVTEDRVKQLIIAFKTMLQSKFLRIHEAYRVLAPGGAVTCKEIMEFFRSSSCTITQQEAILLVQYMSPHGNGVVPYEDFIRVMDIPNSHNMDETSLHPRSLKNVQTEANEEFALATMSAAEIGLTRSLKQQLVDKLNQRRGTLQEVFRLLAGNRPNGKLNRSAFSEALNEQLHFNVTPREHAILVGLLFNGREDRNGDITVKQFHDFVQL